MANLLLSPEKDLARSHVVKTICDPACGTGGMLQEYCTALITVAVTGKIDVRTESKTTTLTP
jgi:tRNA G10  N-methylase Trm11